MAKTLSGAILISFIALATFGSAVVLAESMEAHGHCLAFALAGKSCHKNEDLLSFVLHQLSGLAKTFQGLINPLLVIAVFSFAQFFVHTGPKLSHWLALHENSPAF